MSGAHPHRFWTLDALRGFCALVVFLSHWVFWARFTPQSLIEIQAHAFLQGAAELLATLTWPRGGNHPAVICFFVLSGFCIHHGVVAPSLNARSDRGWRTFYLRRGLRILPVYWVAALLGLVLVAAERGQPTQDPLLALHAAGSPLDGVIRLFGLTNFYPHEILAGNGTLNTVGVELALYAAYPLFHRCALQGRWGLLATAFLALELVGLALLRVFSPYWVYNTVFMFGLFWFAGAYAAHIKLNHPDRSYTGALLVSWLIFLGLNATPNFIGAGVLRQNAFGMVCFFGVLQCVRLEQAKRTWSDRLSFRLLRYSGRVSYSLYAVHTPALLLATWALLHARVNSYLVQLAVTLAAALAATAVSYYGIERVFHRPRPARAVQPTTQTAEALR